MRTATESEGARMVWLVIVVGGFVTAAVLAVVILWPGVTHDPE